MNPRDVKVKKQRVGAGTPKKLPPWFGQYRPPWPRKLGTPPWIITPRKTPPKTPGKGVPAPQLDFGTFPGIQRSPTNGLPVVWVWHSPDKPDVEAWAMLRSAFEVMNVSAPPMELHLPWAGLHAFRPPTPADPHQPYTTTPWGDPTNAAHRNEFLLFIANNWSNVSSVSDLDLLLFDWSGSAQAAAGTLGLFAPGVYRVREGTMNDPPVAWVLHQPGFCREIWKLLDPPNAYRPPGSTWPDETFWFEGVPGKLPPPKTNPAIWFDHWVRTDEGVGSGGRLVTHDVAITQV